MDKKDIKNADKLPETFLLVRGKNSDRKWTQEILHEYSSIRGITFQEVVWEILFVAASRMELDMYKKIRK